MQEYNSKLQARYLGPRPSLELGYLDRTLILLGVVLLGYWIGASVASGSLLKYPVLLAGVVVVGVPSFLYFRKGLSFEKAFVMMVLTLPLLYGFVFDIGGNLRLTYLFTVLAFFLGLQQGKLRKFPKTLSIQLLLAFVFYAIASTAFTLWIDFSTPMEEAGFRLTPFRAFVQAGQLILMVMAFYLTLNYVTSPERLRQFCNVVFWSTALITLYGIYDFAAALFDLPFFSVIYDTSYYAGGAADNPFVSIGNISLPRPRSTLGEPLDLSIFLLFGIPFSVAAVSDGKPGLTRWLKASIILFEVLLLLVANARSSFLALLVVVPVLLWLSGSFVAGFRLILVGVGLYMVVALVLFPLSGGQGNLVTPLKFYWNRIMSVAYLPASLKGDEEALGQIGRNYAKPLEVFKENPILGVGLGNYSFYYSKGMDQVILADPFGLYQRLLTELGILGTSLFLLFVARIVWVLVRVIRRLPDPRLGPFAKASLVAIVGVMVAKVGLSGLTTDSYWWVMLAVGAAIPRLTHQGQVSTRPPLPV